MAFCFLFWSLIQWWLSLCSTFCSAYLVPVSLYRREASCPWGQRYSQVGHLLWWNLSCQCPLDVSLSLSRAEKSLRFWGEGNCFPCLLHLSGTFSHNTVLLMVAYLVLLERFLLNPGEEWACLTAFYAGLGIRMCQDWVIVFCWVCLAYRCPFCCLGVPNQYAFFCYLPEYLLIVFFIFRFYSCT